MLPLGLRVQEKLERLIDKYMRLVGKQASFCSYAIVLTRRRRFQGLAIFIILSRALGAV